MTRIFVSIMSFTCMHAHIILSELHCTMKLITLKGDIVPQVVLQERKEWFLWQWQSLWALGKDERGNSHKMLPRLIALNMDRKNVQHFRDCCIYLFLLSLPLQLNFQTSHHPSPVQNEMALRDKKHNHIVT